MNHHTGFSAERICFILFVLLLLIVDSKGANHPEPLRSMRDIESNPTTLADIYIAELPIDNYPFLAKFIHVKRIRLNNTLNRADVGATDEKLKSLSKLSFTNLIDVALLNCPRVTDAGINALAKLGSLRLLQLEGTSITDSALDVISEKMRITGVNIANCRGVMMKGLRSLATSDTLRDVTFSATNLSQRDIVQLISDFKTNVTRCEIIDTERKIATAPLKAAAANKGMQLFFYSKGALQLLQDGTGKRDKL